MVVVADATDDGEMEDTNRLCRCASIDFELIEDTLVAFVVSVNCVLYCCSDIVALLIDTFD